MAITSSPHVAKWFPIVKDFLKRQGILPLGGEIWPPSNTPAPPGLPDVGTSAYHEFLIHGPYNAFATNGAGTCSLAMQGLQ
jgi:hypothetical protein